MELHSTFDLELEIDKFITKYIFFDDITKSTSGRDLELNNPLPIRMDPEREFHFHPKVHF